MEETNLEKAKRLYPKGIKFKGIGNDSVNVFESDGEFIVLNDKLSSHYNSIIVSDYVFIYNSKLDKWAEIIEQKEEVPSVEVGKCYKFTDKLGVESYRRVRSISGDLKTVNSKVIFRNGMTAIVPTSLSLDMFRICEISIDLFKYCIDTGRFISEDEFNKFSKVETVEYVNGEEVELDDPDIKEWVKGLYISKHPTGYHVVEYSEECILQVVPDDMIRKSQPVKQPEIDSLCLFSNYQDATTGFVDKLKRISEDNLFFTPNFVGYRYCRQIEPIKFKD